MNIIFLKYKDRNVINRYIMTYSIIIILSCIDNIFFKYLINEFSVQIISGLNYKFSE